MAKKLGKKARKFAKKNLQSVMKRKRMLHAKFSRKLAPRANHDVVDKEKAKLDEQSKRNFGGNVINEPVSGNDLDNLFAEDDDIFDDNVSDSDGYLSEDNECPYISGSENDDDSEDRCDDVDVLEENIKTRQKIAKHKSKLERLQNKDPMFLSYLEGLKSERNKLKGEEMFSDDEGDISDLEEAKAEEVLGPHNDKILTCSTIDVWCWMVMEEPNCSALPALMNVYRSACHYGVDSSSWRIPSRKVFSKILTFVLVEADGIFRRLLGFSGNVGKETLLKLANRSQWKGTRPVVKSFLRSSLFLLNQGTDNQILSFVLSQLRSYVVFFAAFPSLARRLIKVSVHLWATSDGSLRSAAYLMLRDIAMNLPSEYFDSCLSKTYRAFIAHCKFLELKDLSHIEFMLNSVVELYSLDIQKSYQKVTSSMQQLASILRWAIKSKKKEELKKIHSWQYINCTRLWVKFVSSNCREYDIQQLLFLIIQVVRGIISLFPGQRYLPLRFKCIQMLNELSLSSGVFVPVASTIFDCIEFKGDIGANIKWTEHINFSSLLKVPKQSLKSQSFKEECVLSAIEAFSAHFYQWCYHISFPELATIPLILLKKFHESLSLESLRRPVKRLIDQVQQNSDFIQRKRDELSFSPKDQESVDNFLQLEKRSGNVPFTQYYRSILQNSLSRTQLTQKS